MSTTLNVKMLEMVKALIREEPKRIAMKVGISRSGDDHDDGDDHDYDYPECGTVGCIAGWLRTIDEATGGRSIPEPALQRAAKPAAPPKPTQKPTPKPAAPAPALKYRQRVEAIQRDIDESTQRLQAGIQSGYLSRQAIKELKQHIASRRQSLETTKELLSEEEATADIAAMAFGSDWHSIMESAMRILNITREQARALFFEYRWPRRLEDRLWRESRGTPGYAEVVCEAIDLFIADPERFPDLRDEEG